RTTGQPRARQGPRLKTDRTGESEWNHRAAPRENGPRPPPSRQPRRAGTATSRLRAHALRGLARRRLPPPSRAVPDTPIGWYAAPSRAMRRADRFIRHATDGRPTSEHHVNKALAKRIPRILLPALLLAGCGTPAARDFGGRWKPVNRFRSATTEIPLGRHYTYYAAPMDE